MYSRQVLLILSTFLLFASTHLSVSAQSSAATTTVPSTPPPTSSTTSNSTITSTSSSTVSTSSSTAPDVLLNVPQLSVGRIELDVDNLQADINLNAKVANLVTINAGISLSVQTVNITISDVEVQLELIVRLGHLVDIVQRVFQSLDLNPLLITALNDVTSLATAVVGAVDGLLGSITQGGTTLNFLIDNLGNIVQSVVGTAGTAVDTIVGNYLTNMTLTGAVEDLGNGFVQKTYSYTPLNALVNIVFNAAGRVVSAVVAKATGSSTSSSVVATATSSSSTSAATAVVTSSV